MIAISLNTPDAKTAQYLQILLDQYALPCDVSCYPPNQAPADAINVELPIRLGQVIDRIYYRHANPVNAHILDIGNDIVLDLAQFTFAAPYLREPARLTEKEASLLKLLYEEKGAAITRERLLIDIWDYADNVETHTLETHIYRLRQKIEQDPSNPKILITTENGYGLGYLF